MMPLNKILVVIELDDDHAELLKRAAALAKKNQASLLILSVVAPPKAYSLLSKAGTFFTDLLEQDVERTRAELGTLREKLRTDTGQEVTAKVVTGRADLEIVSEAKLSGCDLVLKDCAQSSALFPAVFGSSDMNVMRKCPCPVLILKPSESRQFKKIVVAVDQDEDAPENHQLNLKLLNLAAWLAVADSSELHLLHVWSYPFESVLRSPRSDLPSVQVDEMVAKEEEVRAQWLHDLLEEARAANPQAIDYLDPRQHVVKGNADLRIVEKAKELEADLVVMGTVGRVGIPGLLMGNTSETVLQNLKCSCLAVKPPGFDEPS